MTPTPHAIPTRRIAAMLAGAALPLLLSACSKPQPPETVRPPEPKATQLRDAMQAPIDKAKAVDADTKRAADAQRDAIDAATGG